MILSTGRTVVEREMSNGATHVEVETAPHEMTEAEWAEYWQAVCAMNLERSRARLRNRKGMK